MKGEARQRLLYQLKTAGPQSAVPLAEALGLSAMGVHKQLRQLAQEGLVLGEDDTGGAIGRPRRLWRLTEAGHAEFADGHGVLTVQLIRQVRQHLGEEALDRLIAGREQETALRYRKLLDGQRTLRGALKVLVAARSREGYLARLERAGADWLLIEDHCPICAAAKACQGFCRSELLLFQDCLAPWGEVQRVEHLLAGGRRCAYRVTPGVRSA